MAWASAIGLVVGSLVFTFAWFTRDILFFGNLSDDMRDMSLAIRADGRGAENLHTPLVFLAIDDAAHDALGLPPVTPRDRLATLLENVAAQKPLMIVLDIDVAEPASKEQDVRFQSALASLGASKTPLLLVRGPNRIYAPDSPEQFAQTPYDAIVDSTPTFSWVSAQALRGPEGIARRMLSWVRGCLENRPRYYPGAAIAAANLSARARSESSQSLPAIFPKPDWSCSGPSPQTSQNLKFVRLQQNQGAAIVHRQEPIDYSIIWAGTDSGKKQYLAGQNGRPSQLLTVVPATPFLLNPHFREAGALLNGSIVVVGVSYAGALDYVQTPLGHMPGAFMLLNHIRGVVDFGIEPPASFWRNLFLALLIAVVTANLMIWAGEEWGPWVEIPLPLALSGVWALALMFTVGSNFYFGLSLSPLLVGLAVLALPHRLKSPELRRDASGGSKPR